MSGCPFPGCERPLAGRHAPFCSEHAFAVPPAQLRFLVRMSVKAGRARSDDDRRYLTEQLAGYVHSAVRRAEEPREKVHA